MHIAVPSMLIVVPSGITKDTIDGLIFNSFLHVSIVTGKVALLLELAKAKTNTFLIELNNFMRFSFIKTRGIHR